MFVKNRRGDCLLKAQNYANLTKKYMVRLVINATKIKFKIYKFLN